MQQRDFLQTHYMRRTQHRVTFIQAVHLQIGQRSLPPKQQISNRNGKAMTQDNIPMQLGVGPAQQLHGLTGPLWKACQELQLPGRWHLDRG